MHETIQRPCGPCCPACGLYDIWYLENIHKKMKDGKDVAYWKPACHIQAGVVSSYQFWEEKANASN